MMNKKDLYQLCREVKKSIADDYLAFEEDEIPGIQLTVACNEHIRQNKNDWSYQTGDNSYTDGAYHYPFWAVIGVYKNSNCKDLANDIIDQLEDQLTIW